MVNKIRQEVRIPFFPADSNRTTVTSSSDTDPIIKNAFIDIRSNPQTKEQTSFVVKRPGIKMVHNPTGYDPTDDGSIIPFSGSDYVQGMWIFGDWLFYIENHVLFKVAMSSVTGTTATDPTLVFYTEVALQKFLGVSTTDLTTAFGTDFANDFAYGATQYINGEQSGYAGGQEALYVTNGIETFSITKAGTAYTHNEPANVYTPNTYYKPGDRVIPSTYAGATGYQYMLLGEAGLTVYESTEPTWPNTAYGETVVSAGGNTWISLSSNTPQIYTNRVYTVGQLVIPSVESGYYYQVTTGGTASAEPTWTQLKGDTCTATGGVVFTCLGNYGRPGLVLPNPVYLDTYIVLNAYKSSDLYHSDPTDPNSWNPLNFISADSFTSYTRAIARYNNYIIAYGETDAELFYNNANTSGSTLSRHESFLLQIGTETHRSVVEAESVIAWIGKSAMGGHAIWLLDGFEPREISTPWVNKILENEVNVGRSLSAYPIRIGGHNLLVWSLPTSKLALVFDIGLNIWYYWNISNTAVGLGYPAADSLAWPFTIAATYGNDNGIYLAGNVAMFIYKLSTTQYQDQLVVDPSFLLPVPVEIRTPKIDFGNRKRKFCHSLDVIGDNNASRLDITWSDDSDDYTVFASTPISGASYNVGLNARPRIAPVGSFRRRAFRFFHSANTALRLEGFDLTYTQGIS